MAIDPWSLLEKARKLHDLEKVMEKKEFLRLKHLLAINVKNHRKARGIAQERLGLEIGVDRTVISKIEREVANPALETLNKIAFFFGLKVTDLFVDESSTK